MAIIPAGNIATESSLGTVYVDANRNLFFMIPRPIQEVIEATVTKGRGYLPITPLVTPYAENPLRDKITDPYSFCLGRLEIDKFPGWREDVREGHPEYSKLIHEVISL